MIVISAGIHKKIARIANREDLDQTAPSAFWAGNHAVQCLKF